MKRFQRMMGYSMLEMLVALVVISVGLLAVATLQTRGQQFNYRAYLRTQAVFLAYDIMDRIRANAVAARNGSYQLEAKPSQQKDCTAAPCTAVELASYDLYDWYERVELLLPEAEATVSRNTTGYTIKLSWIEKEDRERTYQTWGIEL